jgi:hypothetical protein
MPLTSEKGRDYIRLTALIISLIDRFAPLAHYHTNPSVGSPHAICVRGKVMPLHHPTYMIGSSCNKNLLRITNYFCSNYRA